MSAKLPQVEKDAMQLSPKERETLAERLVQSLDRVSLTAVDIAWVEEAERRFAEISSGEKSPVPAALALRQIRKRLAR